MSKRAIGVQRNRNHKEGLTTKQVEAITLAWLDLRASRDSLHELEQAFPFLLGEKNKKRRLR